MYFHDLKGQQGEGLAIKQQPQKPQGYLRQGSYQKFLVRFNKYRYVYLLLFSIILLFLVITYAKMIFAIRRNISELITFQRSTYSRDISNIQIDLDDSHKPTHQIITQEQILLAQKWKGIRNQDRQIFSDLANEELQYYQDKYNIIDYEEQPFCIVVYNFDNQQTQGRLENIKSILMQNYNNFHIVYVDKNYKSKGQGNNHIQEIQKLLFEHNQKRIFKVNQRKSKKKEEFSHIIIHTDESIGYIQNLYFIGESHCKQNELILFVDNSDYFIGKQVLKLFNAVYQDKKYVFAYTNFLDGNNEIENLSFLSKKKMNKTLIISNKNIEGPLFAMPVKILSEVLEEYVQNRLSYYEDDERLRINLMLPILQYIKGNTIYIPEVNYAINFVKLKKGSQKV